MAMARHCQYSISCRLSGNWRACQRRIGERLRKFHCILTETALTSATPLSRRDENLCLARRHHASAMVATVVQVAALSGDEPRCRNRRSVAINKSVVLHRPS